MNYLDALNKERRKRFEASREAVARAHDAVVFPAYDAYPFEALKSRLRHALAAALGEDVAIRFEEITRERFGADVCLKFPELLQKEGPKAFIQSRIPVILLALRSAALRDVVADVAAKGMYVNVTLLDRWFLEATRALVEMEADFGKTDALKTRRFVIDYSSPNVAKVLHAGHIRSTIIGHVLGNLCAASGACVFRVNHINDFGGFGFMLEGYRRFRDLFPEGLEGNEALLEIYRIRRTCEKIIAEAKPFPTLSDEERAFLARYFPNVADLASLKQAFEAFIAASDARFEALEKGEKAEVDLWERMVSWSLADFDMFYEKLDVRFDCVIGESFYCHRGQALIQAGLSEKKVIVYEGEPLAQDHALIAARRREGTITEQTSETLLRQVMKDEGAFVVVFDAEERFVVQHANGRSIYATRDLGAIALRKEIFAPTDVVYVAGQEQKIHFLRLFRAAEILGLFTPEEIRLVHLYFGFYVDSATGRKLSSRDTVASVMRLLEASEAYFRERLSDRVSSTPEQVASAARALAIGSLVFNDLKQDVRGAVELDVQDMSAMIAGFEKSGGAYVVYAACRARSILRRYAMLRDTLSPEPEDAPLESEEVALLLKIHHFPERIVSAARQANPSLLVRYLFELATRYNAYYAQAPVMRGGRVHLRRLLITRAVQNVLINGLSLCHVTCPEAI